MVMMLRDEIVEEGEMAMIYTFDGFSPSVAPSRQFLPLYSSAPQVIAISEVICDTSHSHPASDKDAKSFKLG